MTLLCVTALFLSILLNHQSSAQQSNFLYSGNFCLAKCRAPITSGDYADCISYFAGFDAAVSFFATTNYTGMAVSLRYCMQANVTF